MTNGLEKKLKVYNIYYLYILALALISLFWSTSLYAKQQNYCAYNSNAETLLNNYNTDTYFNLSENDKNSFHEEILLLPSDIIIIDDSSIKNRTNAEIAFNGMNEIFQNLQMGERLKLFKLGDDGKPISLFNKCYPGCPTQSWSQSFFGSECIRGKAKKDKLAFKKLFQVQAKKILHDGLNNSTTENNLISKISILSDEISDFSSEDRICIFSDLINNSQYGDFNSNDKTVFDKAFVTAVLKNQIPKKYKENITFYGVDPSPEVRNFWIDIFSISKSNPRISSSICTQ